MDRKDKETEQINKRATTTLKTPTTPKTQNLLKTATDDDTNTDTCDTFETWTLVNDKEKSKVRDYLVNENENRVENLKKSDTNENDNEDKESKMEQEPHLEDSVNDVNTDDLSDGISIISETESVGRISPHPYIRDHLHELNMKFSISDHMDDAILNKMREDMENETVPLLIQQAQEPIIEQQIRQRRTSSAIITERDDHALQKASKSVTISSGLVPLVRRGLRGIFYLGVGLALLGLIGKIVNPTWQPLDTIVNSSPSTTELEQKLNDMELQNNLMRAEIDLLNKQVKYLSTLSDHQQQKPGKYKKSKGNKIFQAWPGNGDSLQPVDITKRDLKKPYKCPDGSFVEIANMCIEKRPVDEPSLIDQLGQVMEDVKVHSEAIKTFEEVAEDLQGFQDNPIEQLQNIFKEELNTEKATKQFVTNKPIHEASKNYKENLASPENYKKHRPKGENPNSSASSKLNKHDNTENRNNENYNSKNEYKKSLGKEYKKYTDNENIHDISKERNEWKTNNSKERKYRKDNSKERYTKDFDGSKENSKEKQFNERYNKQKHKYNDDSGEWQENYMKHREQQRKQNEQRYQDNKNWYIKRGDSRENKRNGEKYYR